MSPRRLAALVAKYAVLELRLYLALIRWCLRRRDVPAGAEPWGYAQLVTPVMWLWIFGSATELVVLHLLLTWERIRLAADVVSAWGLIWMLGTLAAYRIRPHVLTDQELLLRNGVYHQIAVPTAAIATATVRETELRSSVFPLQVDDDRLSLGVSGRTNVVLALHQPTPIATAKGVVDARVVALWLDDPRAFAARVNETARAG